jgi:SAM-dependent methyltransferase
MTEAAKFLRKIEFDPRPLFTVGSWSIQGGRLVSEPAEDLWERISRQGMVRERYIERFGFAIITPKVIRLLKPYAPILEVGAGSGYWAYELRRAGIKVTATDPGRGMYGLRNGMAHWKKPWTRIFRLDGCAAIRKYRRPTLLMVWPDYKATWPNQCLTAFRGSTVIYVGEGDGGCTADDAFHATLAGKFELEAVHPIPQFHGLHDRMQIWKRRRKAK